MTEIRAQGHWSVDDLRSPVVEFTKSVCRDGRIRVGRLWFASNYFHENVVVTKPRSFVDWADNLLNLAKKTLSKQGSSYFGPEAKALVASGDLEVIL